MDQWGGTISITLAGLFWVKDNNGSNAIPASVRQIPGNDMVYVKEKLEDRIDRKSTRLNSSHETISRMPSSA